MQESLMSQGFTLLSYGMGTVFIFLGLLVLVTTVVSNFIVRYFPEPQPAISPSKPSRPKAKSNVSAKTLKVIQAAIDQHRAKRK